MKRIMLPCIAAVAIATFVGKKTFESHVFESDLLSQNVEALSQTEGAIWVPCDPFDKFVCPVNFKDMDGNEKTFSFENHIKNALFR